MRHAGDINPACSRRSFLFAISSTCVAASKTIPPALLRYSDPSTDFPVLRLTDPEFTSVLPAHYQRSVSRRGNYLVCASDASGRMQAYRMDLKTGIATQIGEEEALSPASLTLAPDERSVCCVAGNRLLAMNMSSGRAREVYRSPEGFEATGGLGLAEDGIYAAVVEKDRNKTAYRLRLIRMADGKAATIAESPEEVLDPIPRPRRAAVLYRRGKSLWLANYDGQQNYALRTAEGETGAAAWSPDGRSVLYLNYPTNARKLHNIREFTPDSKQDMSIADTTQYVAFERNADASVFAGASGSKASPHVLLLVREVKRELTLCEHKASDAKMVSPVFSPNSQHVYFVSDRHGKPAIYTVAVDKLVEQTGAQ
ncbi:MAG TPA: oligogalacturonate lyase family protein [Bryobacteraceae bacterium]|jgi:oligogalacturonide lyase